MNQISAHRDPEVRAALIRLCDALCSWERSTGRTSALILKEQGGFFFRAASGKPSTLPENEVDNEMFIATETQ